MTIFENLIESLKKEEDETINSSNKIVLDL